MEWLSKVQIPAEVYALVVLLCILRFYRIEMQRNEALAKRFHSLLERTMSIKFLMWGVTTVFAWYDNIVWNYGNLKWEWWMAFTVAMAGINVTQKGVFQFFNGTGKESRDVNP